MKVIIFGGTGFIGRELVKSPGMDKYEIFIPTRNPVKYDKQSSEKIHFLPLTSTDTSKLESLFSGKYAVINLAGESIAAKLWSQRQKRKILDSRINITKSISEMVNRANEKPVAILQGSAVGFYGSQGDKPLDENSEKGDGFLADVVKQWEDSLLLSEPLETRVVFLRTGLVLGKSEGLLHKLRIPFYLFGGGHMGNGRQWMPWIHVEDEVEAIVQLLQNKDAKGVFNLCSTKPVRMKQFCKVLGEQLKRPSWIHIPTGIIKLILGEFGKELLLSSHHVKPLKLLDIGFRFKFENINEALSNLVNHE